MNQEAATKTYLDSLPPDLSCRSLLAKREALCEGGSRIYRSIRSFTTFPRRNAVGPSLMPLTSMASRTLNPER